MENLSDKEISAVRDAIEMEMHLFTQQQASEMADYVGELLVSVNNEFDSGMGATPGMWEMVSDLLNGEKLPKSVSDSIKALAQGLAVVVPRKREVQA